MKRYGCIGKVLVHSFSKEIHARLADYDYELMELSEDELPTFFAARDFAAINVTIPYKERVIPFLNEIDEFAVRVGAVNTVVNRNGKLTGYNTDYYGMTALILRMGLNFRGKKVLILGSGGTAKCARAVTEDLGAKDILTLSRKEQKHSRLQTVTQFIFVILISLMGFALIVRIAPLRNIAPFLTSLQGSVALNLLAVGLGLAAWGCGLVGILYGRRLPKGQWRSYSITSFCLCSISLWIPLLLMTGYSRTEDIIMFLDTMGGYNFGAMTLLFISFVLNITSYIRNRNN